MRFFDGDWIHETQNPQQRERRAAKTQQEKRREDDLKRHQNEPLERKDPFDELFEMDLSASVARDDICAAHRCDDGLDKLAEVCCPPRIVADNDFESTIRGGLDDDLLPDPPSTEPDEESALGDLDATLSLEEGFGGSGDPGVPDVSPGEWRDP